jgi:hypothetical protein
MPIAEVTIGSGLIGILLVVVLILLIIWLIKRI